MPKFPHVFCVALALSGCLLSPLSHAALTDEIQVYTDEINDPGEFGVELHAITFPRGRKTPDYAGEVTTDHSLFVTPELSWGLTKTLEAGLYLPGVRDGATGHLYLAGVKGRIKWLPIKGDEETGGWFAGANLEVGRVGQRFNQVRSNAELRIMGGWRNEDWLLGVNPVIGWELSDAAAGKPGYGFGLKGTRRVAEGMALGLEYYTDRGQIGATLPWEDQDNKLFVVMDYDRKPWVFNLGIGKGMTHAAEKTTLKAIFELPF
ncbi:MAG: hypothetical protein EKK46_05710 [Rhodocyclaceae bacterium]|nr:MAG: hypothetical protein EKK46_05710 [Rhodocyclaceae bacterium]